MIDALACCIKDYFLYHCDIVLLYPTRLRYILAIMYGMNYCFKSSSMSYFSNEMNDFNPIWAESECKSSTSNDITL